MQRTIGLCLCGCLSTLAILAAPTPPKAPGSAITVFPGVQVSTDEPEARHVESVLAVNPRDPKNLVAASMVLGASARVAVYASHDGGLSWSRGKEGVSGSSMFDGIDPAVAFDREGNAYLLALGDHLALWRSSDGGLTWVGRAVVPGSSWDRPWISAGASGRASPDGRVYVAGKLPITVFGHQASDVIALSMSRDHGATFSFPKLLLPAPEKSLLNVVGDLLEAPDGRLILTLQTFPPESLGHSPLAGSYPTIVSSDGGRTFTEPRCGDTQGIVGLPGGAFHLAWIQATTSEMQLWSVRVVVDPAWMPARSKPTRGLRGDISRAVRRKPFRPRSWSMLGR